MSWKNWLVIEVVAGPVDVLIEGVMTWKDPDGTAHRMDLGERALDGAACFRKDGGQWETWADSGRPAVREDATDVTLTTAYRPTPTR